MRCLLYFLLFSLAYIQVHAQIRTGPGGFPEISIETATTPGELLIPRISNDLATWESLPPVAVGTDGMVRFTDFGGLTQSRRFYQAVAVPDSGAFLIYERRAANGTSIIYRSRLDGTGETALVVGRYPRPSFDGRWILLTRDGTGPSGHRGADLYAYDTTVIAGVNNPHLLYGNNSSDIVNYAFKHDNSGLVFDFGLDSESGIVGRLYTMTVHGGLPQVYFPNGDCVEAMPSFSPDDSTLVFAHRIPSQITTRRPGGVKQPLTPSGKGDSWPQWSPDGRAIAACDGNTDISRTDLGHDLLSIDPLTGTRTPLTQMSEPGDGFPCGGVWSANSLWIYAAGTVGGIQGVWRVPASGGALQPVPLSSPFDVSPGISTAPVVFVGGIVP